MIRYFALNTFMFFAGLTLLCPTVNAQGTVGGCTIASNPGGQLGFLRNQSRYTGMSSYPADGGQTATVLIDCPSGQRDLQINNIVPTSSAASAFNPTDRRAEAIRIEGGGAGNNRTTFNNGLREGVLRLAGNARNVVTVDMLVNNPNANLPGGTYSFNVVMTVVAN